MLITLQGAHGNYIFDPQDISARLGQGGMGAVFKGSNTNSGEPVAVKVLYKEITANISAVERERQSAGIRVDSKHLIRMLDFVEQNGIFHIISELVEGITLHSFLQDMQQQHKRIDHDAALNVINQVMDGLTALHNNQPPVIHRDIDPSNIMLCSDGTVKIMDFGIARISDGKRKSLTGMGTVIGKPHYSPPEQIRGESDKINQSTDIYALGITIYEMLTGDPPFNATNEYDVMKMQIEKPLPFHAAIPAPVFKVIQKATEKRQEKRYPTVKAFRDDLNAAFKPQTALPQPRPQKYKQLITMALLVLIPLLSIAWIAGMVKNKSLAAKYDELQTTAMPITITNVEIANSDENLRNISDYGEQLYSSRLRYLRPKLFFTTNTKKPTTVLLVLKYFSEKGVLIKNDTYKSREDLYGEYTQFIAPTINPGDTNKELIGFGSANSSTFNAGMHKLEVWLGNVLLYTKDFSIRYSY